MRLRSIGLLAVVFTTGCIAWSAGGNDSSGSPTPTTSPSGTPTTSPTGSPTGSPTPLDLHVQLAWPTEYTQADLDLHLINPVAGGTTAGLFDVRDDCHWRNCMPSNGEYLDWGPPDAGLNMPDAADPALDIDNIISTVPENIRIPDPATIATGYDVVVHYFGDHSSGGGVVAHPNVYVYEGGTLVYQASATLAAPNDAWRVCRILYPAGTVTSEGEMFSYTYSGFVGK